MTNVVNVLFVEDNPGDIRRIQEYLRNSKEISIKLEVVGTLKEALAFIQVNIYDLILLDLGLSDSKGLDTVHKTIAATSEIPIVILTGNDDEEKAIDSLNAGASDYLVKDKIDSYGLTRAIRYALSRNEIEQRIRKSEEMFRNIFESIPSGMFEYELDTEGRLIFRLHNPAASSILGVDCSKFVGMTLEEAFPPLAATEVPERFREAASKGISWKNDDLQYDDGVISGVYESHAFQTSPNRMVTFFTDISERKRNESALRQWEESLSRAFEESAIGMVWLHPTGTFKRVNRAYCEITGYSEEELLQKTFQEITYPEDYDIGTDIVQRLLGGEIVSGVIEKRYVRKDGSIIHCKMTSSLIRNSQGDPIHFSTQVEDITKEKATTIALQDSEAKFRSITENSPEHIMLHTLDGEILFINRTVPDLTVDEVIGQSVFNFTPPQFHDDAAACFKRVFESGESDQYHTEYEAKDGSIHHFEVRIGPVIQDGKVVTLVSSSFDITERKRLKEELEQLVEERTKELIDAQEQLIRSERLSVLGQLSGGIGHELRNPLATIKNSVYYLKMALDNPTTETRETLEILDTEIKTAESIIRSLLDYAQPSRQNLRKTNINKMINSSLLQVEIPEGIKLTTSLDSKVPDLIADSVQLRRIVVNLCRNAIQAMRNEGKLTVKTKISEPGLLQISVTDTGEGMTEEIRKHLFEPLFTTKAKGIGLGLPIANLFTKAHGGSIEVQSKVGKGTTFTVSIPLENKK